MTADTNEFDNHGGNPWSADIDAYRGPTFTLWQKIKLCLFFGGFAALVLGVTCGLIYMSWLVSQPNVGQIVGNQWYGEIYDDHEYLATHYLNHSTYFFVNGAADSIVMVRNLTVEDGENPGNYIYGYKYSFRNTDGSNHTAYVVVRQWRGYYAGDMVFAIDDSMTYSPTMSGNRGTLIVYKMLREA